MMEILFFIFIFIFMAAVDIIEKKLADIAKAIREKNEA